MDLAADAEQLNMASGEEITDIESRKRKMDNMKKVSQFTSTNKKLRLEGKDYLGISVDKDTKMTTYVLRGGKTVKPACPPSSRCMKDSSKSAFQCHKLSPEDREGNFTAFWNTNSWPERKAFVSGLTEVRHPKRVTNEASNVRQTSVKYFLKTGSGEMVPVCANNFANTFGVSKRTIQSWISLKTKERSAETPAQKKTGALRANRKRKLINPPDRNLGGPFFLIEWIESKKKHIAKASEIWCLEETNPTFENKKYNVLYSEAGGKKVYKSAIILKGPGSFQEMNSWLIEKDGTVGGKRQRKIKRFPPKSLEFASEDAAFMQPAKKTKRGPKTAQTPLVLLEDINMPEAVEDSALAGDGSTQETPEVHLEIRQSEAREWDFSGLAFSDVEIQPQKKAVGKKKSRESVLAKKDENESRTLLETACDQLASQMRKPEEEKQMSKTDGVGEKSRETVSAKKDQNETRSLLKTASDQLASQKKNLEEEKQISKRNVDDNRDVHMKLLMDLHKKVDKILEMMAKNNPDTTSPDEPPLLQVLNNRWVYIGRGYVVSHKRYSNAVIYACSEAKKFVSQITKAIFGKELLSQSRLAPNNRPCIKSEGQKLTFLEPALLDAIFMTQERFSQDRNITPLAMSQIQRIVSYLCERTSDVKCPWSTPGFKKLSQIEPDDDDDEDPQETSDQGEVEEEVSIEREEYYVDEDQYHNLNSDGDKHEEEVEDEEKAEEEVEENEAEETDFEDNKVFIYVKVDGK
ncbi:uncharacterized protein LOC135940006 isoform X2 [Cloeon dipterum]|uniref:uncharacterized protein LOC135940006 isoform X2 n=1 Tax=Cloeon dipterum TaxID=197152 RepID=UPI00321FB309